MTRLRSAFVAVADLKLTRTATLLLAVVALALIALLASRAEGGPLDPPGAPGPTDGVRLDGTAIPYAGYVITQSGHYYLTRNMIGGGPALQIDASDVSIDLGGFTFDGSNQAGAGVIVHGSRVTIYNGTINNYYYGIDMASSSDDVIHDVMITSDRYANGAGYGIYMGSRSVVEDCTVTDNIIGIQMAGTFNEVRNCLIYANTFAGIVINGGLSSELVERNTISSNNTSSNATGGGVISYAGRTTIRENEFTNNAIRDVHMDNTDTVVIDNVFSCSNWFTFGGFGPANNYVPMNSTTIVHTNRSHLGLC